MKKGTIRISLFWLLFCHRRYDSHDNTTCFHKGIFCRISVVPKASSKSDEQQFTWHKTQKHVVLHLSVCCVETGMTAMAKTNTNFHSVKDLCVKHSECMIDHLELILSWKSILSSTDGRRRSTRNIIIIR